MTRHVAIQQLSSSTPVELPPVEFPPSIDRCDPKARLTLYVNKAPGAWQSKLGQDDDIRWKSLGWTKSGRAQ